MKKPRLLCAVCAGVFACLFAHTSNAAIVTFNFVAEVTEVGDSSLFLCPSEPLSPCRVGSGGMVVGDHFQGSYTYDSNTTGVGVSVASGTSRKYVFSSTPNELTIDINSGYTFRNYQLVTLNDAYLSSQPDQVIIGTPLTSFPNNSVADFYLEFWSPDMAAIETDALPIDPLNLGLFGVARGTFRLGQENGNFLTGLNFNILSLTAVPIPPALYLFGTGLLGLIGIVRKKAA